MNLPNTVKEADEIPFSDYEEFLNLEKAGKVRIETVYDGHLVPSLGDTQEIIMNRILVYSLLVIAIILVAIPFIFSNFWFLFGIPLAILGFFLSTPFFMNSIGHFIDIITFTYFVYSLIIGNFLNAVLAGSYVFPNYIVSVARTQCDMIIRRSTLKSESVFIELFYYKKIFINKI
ncbi:hypothetical protein ACFL6H_02100 [Candidatus Latescibacterota bacterium]